MQFVYVRAAMAVLTVVTTVVGIHEHVYVWLPITVVLNISMTVAFYALMLFYHSFEDPLSKGRQRPLAKFLCIKGVVFFCFWQGIIVQILEWVGVIMPGKFFDVKDQSHMIQDALICFEMAFIFAPLHVYSFSFQDYQDEKSAKIEKEKKSQ